MKLQIHTFELPLQHEFTISRNSTLQQPTMIVELSDGTHHGYGEATSNSYYGMSIEKLCASVESVREYVESHQQFTPELLCGELASRLQAEPFALCALDQAIHDLWGKQQGKPVYELWGLSPRDLPLSNFTIGIDTVEVMVRKIKEVPDWPIYKIKLGTDHDLEIVEELRKHTEAVFRVDANCGWTSDETVVNSRALKQLGVEFIEQPLPADDLEGYRRLFQESELPVIADESCAGESDVKKCHECFHGINIKLVKCGGLLRARRMIAEARQLGMKVMVGCMTESTVGISAIAQLLPLLDYVDMDGAALLAEDIAEGVSVENGVCRFPDRAGNGVALLRSNPR